jgi:hypothetical protein
MSEGMNRGVKGSRGGPREGPRLEGGSAGSRRVAAAVLEVLGGVLTPRQAAGALAVGLPRYYHLERQALEGLLRGCEPKAKGRRERTPLAREERLTREVKRLERDLLRYQALVRAAQRSAGIMPPKAQPARRKRRTPVRALKVVRALRKAEEVGSKAETAPDPSGP